MKHKKKTLTARAKQKGRSKRSNFKRTKSDRPQSTFSPLHVALNKFYQSTLKSSKTAKTAKTN